MKHTRPVHGKSYANGKQQESSTDAEKATRDQPGCKTSHQIPLGKKTYVFKTAKSIDKRVMKPETGNREPRQNRPFKNVSSLRCR